MRRFDVDKAGRVSLPEGTLLLRAAPTETQTVRAFVRRNERLPLTRTISAGRYEASEIKAILHRNLRRPHKSKQSRDSMQSMYHCVFAACGHVMHADVNAAINIGRRFSMERLIPTSDNATKSPE